MFCKISDCSRTVTFKAEVDSGYCVEHLHFAIDANKQETHRLDTELCRARGQLAAARDAITYALRRVGSDAEFAHHMLHTETLDQLIRAYARIENRDPGSVREDVLKRSRLLPQSRCAADKEFLDDRGRL